LSKHEQKYEAEFVVMLNMTKAHETGAKMGIVINRNADFEPATVWRVQKSGLIEEWNKANPGKDVHVGDELVRVNDIQWHANTETFMQRIHGQFDAGRKRVDGASDILRLYIQRPRKWQHKRFASQREGLHDELYAKEFVVEVPLPDGPSPTTMDNVMGWKLGATEEWEPVTLKKIEQHGPLADWNQFHNDSLVLLEGDEILKVDKVIWHHNSTNFMTNLQKHFKATQLLNSTSKSVALSIRRPRPVQEAFDEAHPIEQGESCRRVKSSVTFHFPEKLEDRLLGWNLAGGAKSETGVEGPVLVEKVTPTGLVAKWNTEHLSRKIEPGDQIVTLNGVAWDKYGSAKEFSDAVHSVLSTASHAGPSGEPVRLGMEKPICGAGYSRPSTDVSQATNTSFAEGRSSTAGEPGAKGDSREDTARPVLLQQTVAEGGKETEDGQALVKSRTAEGDALVKVKARIAEIETTLKTLEALKDPKVVALVVELKSERDGLRTTLFAKDAARIAEIETTLKTLEPLKEPKVVALVAELAKERDELRTKLGANDHSADATGASDDAKADGAEEDSGDEQDAEEDEAPVGAEEDPSPP
jgi:hypothetical protein